jgi:hypothetical protein
MPDSAEIEVKEWPSALCRDCGRPFPQTEAWSRRCFVCYKQERSYDLLKGDKYFLWAQVELQKHEKEMSSLQGRYQELRRKDKERARVASPKQMPELSETLIRNLIQLCHPDRHNNNPKATAATRALLALRAAARNSNDK